MNSSTGDSSSFSTAECGFASFYCSHPITPDSTDTIYKEGRFCRGNKYNFFNESNIIG